MSILNAPNRAAPNGMSVEDAAQPQNPLSAGQTVPWVCLRCRICLEAEPTACEDDRCRAFPNLKGTSIGPDVVLDRPIGVGAMGAAVWYGHHRRIANGVAVKMLAPDDPATTAAFEREGRLGASLSHPNLVPTYDHGLLPNGYRYIVMERAAGTSLSRVLAQEPLAPARAAHVAQQVLQGLEHAHARGILHRDIKPGNILLSQREGETDFAILVDFGLAERIRPGGDAAANPDAEGTENRQGVCGTLTFLAPEVLRGEPATPQADLYAVGALLYVLLSGGDPFPGATPGARAQAIREQPPQALPRREDRRTVPIGIKQLVYRALEKDPANRFASATEMRRALREAVATAAAEGLEGFAAPTLPPDVRPPQTAVPPHAVRKRVTSAPAPAPGLRWPWWCAIGPLVAGSAAAWWWIGGW